MYPVTIFAKQYSMINSDSSLPSKLQKKNNSLNSVKVSTEDISKIKQFRF